MMGIYALLFSDNSIYIGKSGDYVVRYKGHIKQFKDNKHPNAAMQSLYNKLGEPILMIIRDCINYEDMPYTELHYITKYLNNEAYNVINKQTKLNHKSKTKYRDFNTASKKIYTVDISWLTRQEVINIKNKYGSIDNALRILSYND